MTYIIDIMYNIMYISAKGDKMNRKMKAARIEKGFSQEVLAKHIGVSRQTIVLIEKDAYNPSLNICIHICQALDRSLDDLFWPHKESSVK